MTLSDSQAVVALLRMEQHIDRLEAGLREPIAIVGVGARTPFEALDVSIWEGLSKGLDASRDVPADRWDPNAAAHTPKRGSFLPDVQRFDANFFAIAPVEAQAMDPHQRLALETAWDALSDAGLSLDAARQVRTGVFLGACNAGEYAVLSSAVELPDEAAPYVATGNAASIIAGRVSYVLGLKGPSFVVDTACSASLLAVHLACESLRARTSDVALAGGVSLMLSPDSHIMLSNLGALSMDGRCRTFDATGSGYGRGEGCGIIVLERLSDAIRNGDRILALVRGSAVNQDGRSDGLTAPNGLAQQQVVRTALEFAKIAPGDVQYVEAHGTGTVLGDPIEVEALSEVFGATRTKTSPLMIGSVKSNIGHLEGAAGISGLIKVILSIQHRELPPNLHLHTPNPHIPWERTALRVQTKLGPWPNPDKNLIAGVSSFGFSGTNVHAVVSEPPPEAADAWKRADRLAAEAKLLPLCVSAKTPEALRAYAKRFAEYLSRPLEGDATWRDVSYTSGVRRTHLDHRLVVVGANAGEWREALASFAEGERASAVVSGDATSPVGRAVFVFSGQGTQWWGMGRELLESEPVFRATLEECAAYIRKDADWSLLAELGRGEASSQLERTDIAQPALVSLQMGLVRLLASWGVEPSAVVGHSVGEISAACTAGVLTLEQACRVATLRGRVMHKASGQGKMASVRLSAERAEMLVRAFPGLEVGAYNGPESVVLSGASGAVESALATLKAQGLETKELRVDYAFHSAQMDPFKSELASALAWLKPSPSRLPIVSTLTATTDAAFDGAYWVRQMREPVRFVDAMRALLGRDQSLFVEVGPHPVLLASVDEIAMQSSKRAVVVSTLKRNEEQSRCALQALGALHAAGYPIDWKKVFAVPGRVASLPSYPWQRERHWLPTPKTSKGRRSDSPWALIQTHVASSDQPGKHLFEVELDPTDTAHGYLADHKVNGAVSLPGAAYGEMVLEAAAVAFEGRGACVEELALSTPLVFAEGEATLVQLVVQPEQEGVSTFRIASRPSKKKTSAWTEHASGRLVLDREHVAEVARAPLFELQKRCKRDLVVGDLYDDFEDAGISYGASFRAIEQAWTGDGEALAKLAPIGKLTKHERGYALHPLVLEAALQTLAAAMPASSSRRICLVSTLGGLHVVGKAAPRWAHVTLRSATDEAVESDVRLLDDEGGVVAEVRVRSTPPLRGNLRDLFEVVWQTSTPNAAASAEGQWLLFADEQGVASALRSWLEGRGASVVTVARGKGFTKEDATHYALDPFEPDALLRLMKEAFGKSPPKRVVHLWSLDVRHHDAPLTEDAIRRAVELGCVSGLHLVRAIAESGWGEAPRLFLITRGCQAAASSRDVAMPEQALLWGYGATLEHEMPDLRTTLVDLDAGDFALESFATELTRADDERRVALRGGERRVARLARVAGDGNEQAHLDPDKTYLVTEGRGGMGLAIAERLTKMGAKHLVLFGRSPPGDATPAVLERLAESGAHVDVVDVDIQDRGAVERALVDLERKKRAIAGVFHAVGVDEDGALSSLSAARIATALAPSMLGAVWLDQLVSAPGLFVLCSSASSALVSAGRSNSTATSAFFDAFAHYQTRSARHALSINWGGALGTAPVAEDAERFGRVLASPSVQVAAIDFRQWRRANSHLTRMPLVQDLVSGRKARQGTDAVAVQAVLREILKQFTPHPKVTEDANLLGVVDSLGAVSFLRAVEKSFGLRSLASRVRGQVSLSLGVLTKIIVRSLASDQEVSPDARKHSLVLPNSTRRPPRATNAARCYAELFGVDGLQSNVWEADDGVSLEVLDEGSGPPLLLLPPFGCEAAVWKPFFQYYRTGRRIIMANLPGYGRSPLPEELTLEAIASALLAIIEVLEPTRPIDVVGWSLGGFLTQMLAAAVPTRFRTMTLVNTTAHLGMHSFEDYESNLLKLRVDLNRDLAIAEHSAELQRLVEWGAKSRVPELTVAYSDMVRSFDARSTASAIHTPTLIIAGEKDYITSVSMGRHLHEAIPGSRLEVMSNVGHYIPLFRPAEFAGLVADHLGTGL